VDRESAVENGETAADIDSGSRRSFECELDVLDGNHLLKFFSRMSVARQVS